VSDEDVSAWIVEDYFEDNFEETACRATSWDVVKHYHPPREKREKEGWCV
jgi:hypothetical protein